VFSVDAPSRGTLVTDFLTATWSTAAGLEELARRGARCNPFNLMCSDGLTLGVYESTIGRARALDPGVYALSNHLLDTPWPKVRQAKSQLRAALDELPQAAAMLDLLRDDETAADVELPRTGVSLELERMLSSASCAGDLRDRCSTIFTVRWTERPVLPSGAGARPGRWPAWRAIISVAGAR